MSAKDMERALAPSPCFASVSPGNRAAISQKTFVRRQCEALKADTPQVLGLDADQVRHRALKEPAPRNVEPLIMYLNIQRLER